MMKDRGDGARRRQDGLGSGAASGNRPGRQAVAVATQTSASRSSRTAVGIGRVTPRSAAPRHRSNRAVNATRSSTWVAGVAGSRAGNWSAVNAASTGTAYPSTCPDPAVDHMSAMSALHAPR